jgi:hypothetical protein
VRSLLLIATILWAATGKNTKTVKDYFLVQLATTILTEIVLHLYGWQSDNYRIAYSAQAVAVLLASWGIVAGTRPGFKVLAIAVSQAVFVFVLAMFGLPAVSTIDTWILVITGTFVTFLGMALGLQCRQHRAEYVPLALLWLVLGSFYFTVALARESQHLIIFEDWFSYMAGIAVFGWFGFNRKRRQLEFNR